MTQSTRSKRFGGVAHLGAAGLAIAAILSVGGCYERVVSSKGVGAQQVEPGYRSNTMLDRAYDDLTGTSEPKKSKPKVGGLRAR